MRAFEAAGRALPFEQIKALEPERYAAWRRADPSFHFPGGESLQELQDRVLAALTRDPCPWAAAGARRLPRRRDPCDAAAGATVSSLDAFWDFEVPNVAVVTL